MCNCVVPSSTWCGACRQIIVELPLIIDYLCVFILLSLLITKMHNYSLCFLFVKSRIFLILKHLGSRSKCKLFRKLKCIIVLCLFVVCLGLAWAVRLKHLGSSNNVKLKGFGSGNHV